MANILTPNEYATLADIASYEGSNGEVIQNIINEHVKALTLGADIPVTEATGNMEDEGFFEEPWEYDKSSKTYDLTNGRPFVKTGTYKRKDVMGLRGSSIGIDKDIFDQKGAHAKYWEAQQIYQVVRNIGLDCEHDMFYGNPTSDPNSSLGLMPRHSVITDLDGVIASGDHKGELCTYITVDGSYGTATTAQNGKLGSVYITHLSSNNGVCWVYPAKSNYTGGVEVELSGDNDWQFQILTNASGVQTAKKQRIHQFRRAGGLVIKNRYACYRIANVDFSTDEGMKNFVKALYDVCGVVPQDISGELKLYFPKRALSSIKMYFNNRIYPSAYDTAKPKNLIGDFNIDGLEFKGTSQLELTEDLVS